MNSQRIHQILGLTVVLLVVQFLMVTAYAWPAADAAPRNLPVAITGPSTSVAIVSGKISDADPGAFTFVPAASATAARADITSRVTYGAIVLGNEPNEPRVLIASGASPAVASVLTQLGSKLAGNPATPKNVTDIVPATRGDSSGGFGLTVLPLMLTSLIAGALLTMRVRRSSHRLLAIVGFSITGGLMIAGVAHSWFGIIPGDFIVIASVIALGELAISAGVSGLAELGHRFGRRAHGLGLGYAVLMLIGNPFSGMNSAPQLLPGDWGTIGQALPTGAVATLLRSVAYFDGARSAGPWTVLGIWAGAGLLLLALAGPRPSGAGHHTSASNNHFVGAPRQMTQDFVTPSATRP